MRQWVDYLILAPLKIEITAVMKALKIDANLCIQLGKATYYAVDVPSRRDGHKVHVRIVQLPNQGTLNAAAFATQMILDWKPWCVVSFGIAGGFLGDDIKLCDVVAPEEIFYYEPAKETRTHLKSTGSKRKATVPDFTELSSNRQSRVRAFGVDSRLHALCIQAVSETGGIDKPRTWPLASGEKLISDIDSVTLSAIREINDKILSVEMEAAGVAAAIQHCAPLVGAHFLAIKGISDDASEGKRARTIDERKADEKNREKAADNAALVVAALISLAVPTYDHLPTSLYQLRSAVLGRVSAFRNALPQQFGHPPEEVEASRFLRDVQRLPPIYYHWRVLHPFVHWLDFCYLRILRSFADQGFPIFLLVTDTRDAATESARKHTESMVASIVGNGASLIWYSDMMKYRDMYVEFAAREQFFSVIDSAVEQMEHTDGERSRTETMNWLYYIAWSATPSERCVVMARKEHANIYRQLMNVLTLDCMILTRDTLVLGGVNAKLSEPGSELVVDPPSYGSILSWLQRSPRIEQIHELSEYLFSDAEMNCDDRTIEELLELSGDRFLDLKDRARDDPSVRRLIISMIDWNIKYFNDSTRSGHSRC